MRHPSHQLKMMVLGAVEFAEGRTRRDRIKAVSNKTFVDEEGRSWRFTWRTIETWMVVFKKHGVTRLEPKTRCDKGEIRKVTLDQLKEAVDQVLPEFREKRLNKTLLYQACLEKGLLRHEQIARNTFSRLVDKYELLKPEGEVCPKKRLAFSKPFANDMWQADTLHGPFIKAGGKSVQAKLIAFIDDASRLVAHGEFFLEENTDNLIAALRSAFYKRGVPKQLYVDNGSIYTSREIVTICARLGILLSHTPVRDGAAKGKIERFFRTVRDRFLVEQLDVSSLDALNRRFRVWVEEHYNTRLHSAIQMRPVDRFGLDCSRINYLRPDETTDELFFIEETRTVKKDNTFSLQNVRYEAPADLRSRQIQVRTNRRRRDAVVVYYKGQRVGPAAPLDPVANDRPPVIKQGAPS